MWLGSLKAKCDILRSPLKKLHFIIRWTLKLLLFIFGHLIYIDNPERLKSCPRPVIFTLNHNNYSESVLVPCSLVFLSGGEKISFLIHWVFSLIPLLNWILRQINPIWVYNRRVRVGWMNKFKPLRRPDIFKQAGLRLQRGRSVGIYPEGSRNNNPFTLKRGRMGVGRIVVESAVPVMPIGIDFPGKIKRRKIAFLGRMVLRVGEPLYFKEEREKYKRMRKRDSKNAADKSGVPRGGDAANMPRGRLAVNALRIGNAANPPHKGRLPERQQRLALYARVSHRIMREISRLCGKEYPYYEK